MLLHLLRGPDCQGFVVRQRYLGIAIETAWPAPRSAIQRVSPAGSTAVGVLSPSLMTVTLALSPSTVRKETLPLPFSARKSLPFAARMPSGPLTGWSNEISTGCPAFPDESIGMRKRVFAFTLFT